MASRLGDGELERRYLDWCATQISRRVLELPPDELWSRAHQNPTADSALPPDPRIAAAHSEYTDLVQRLTLSVAQELQLPRIEQWREEYLRDPARFERDMLDSDPDPTRSRESPLPASD
jgi:hypothetical protein